MNLKNNFKKGFYTFLFSFQVHMLENVKNAYSPGLEIWVLVSNLLLTKTSDLGQVLTFQISLLCLPRAGDYSDF